MRNFLGRRSWRFAVLVAAGFAVAGGVAYATIPSSGNVYTACMLKGVGTIRLIDPSLPSSNLLGHCTSLETQVSWNQNGQPGAPGPPGPQGAKGDAGPTGATGAMGATGPAGPAGPAGADGAQGPPGPAGPQGPAGAAGQEGAGVTLRQLDQGNVNCENGGTQLTATDGTVSYACTGGSGPAGPTGPQGPQGAPGGISGLQYVSSAEAFGSTAGEEVEAIAQCPSGTEVIGGAFTTSSATVRNSLPLGTTEWEVDTTATGGAIVRAIAICADTN
jgi:Collagen triple helix repeat (20 copies)